MMNQQEQHEKLKVKIYNIPAQSEHNNLITVFPTLINKST